MRKVITLMVGTVLLMLVLGACGDSRPEVTPPVSPTLLSTQVTPPVGTPVPLVVVPTAVVTRTATVSVAVPISPTLPVTVTAEAIVVEVLNIRGGPGIDYPVVGVMPADRRVLVVGRSPDGLWLKIQCPAEIVGPQCWIIGGAQYVQVDSTLALATAPAPPVPPTPEPSPTPTLAPCIVNAPADWTSYQIASGDTLSGLADQFGTSVEALMASNCLSTDGIGAGSNLYVPNGGSGPPAGPDVSTAVPVVADAGIAAGFKVGGGVPNDGATRCTPYNFPGLPPHPVVVLLDSRTNERGAFEITELVCIQPWGFQGEQPIQVQVTRIEDGQVQIVAPQSPASEIWTYLLRLGYPEGRYEVMATQGELVAKSTFTVTRASPPPRIRVLTPSVSVGQPAEVIMAGLRPGQRFYLYRLDAALRKWSLLRNRALPAPSVDSFGEATLSVATSAQDNGRCFLVHTGFPETGDISPGDPRVFAVGVDPQNCD